VNYLTSLLESELPFEPWVAALAWVVLFLLNHWIARSTRVANDSQAFIAVEDWSALRRGFRLRSIVVRLLFTAVVFLFAMLLGGSAFVFFAGGLIVSMIFGIALNLQGLFSARALGRPNAASGKLTFTTASAFRHMAHRVGAGAFACLLMGLALAHLALLGGALFLAVIAGGYLQRARNADAKETGEKIPSDD
jgi:hypothetical protein